MWTAARSAKPNWLWYAGFQPSQVLYTSNGIGFNEIEEAVQLGVNINIDSLSNLEIRSPVRSQLPHRYPSPPQHPGGRQPEKISTGHDKSKFGIPIEHFDRVLQLTRTFGLQITDLHIHTGSDIKDADVFVKGIEVLFDLIPHFPELKSVDLGEV